MSVVVVKDWQSKRWDFWTVPCLYCKGAAFTKEGTEKNRRRKISGGELLGWQEGQEVGEAWWCCWWSNSSLEIGWASESSPPQPSYFHILEMILRHRRQRGTVLFCVYIVHESTLVANSNCALSFCIVCMNLQNDREISTRVELNLFQILYFCFRRFLGTLYSSVCIS